jgi:hypothetical protein
MSEYRVVPGPIAADGALPATWTAGVAPAPQTIIAAHFDASAYDNEFVCACGNAYGDLATLEAHIAEQRQWADAPGGAPDPFLSPEMFADEEERQKAIAQMRADGQLPAANVQPCGHPAIDWASLDPKRAEQAADLRRSGTKK